MFLFTHVFEKKSGLCNEYNRVVQSD